ncbi:hypothetical protein SZN_04226 [Streptomyces zinciresistens K42]|uniref:Uncharacterized protein n=1 Tax=Streptomyces zinciresistens K42 TaxID=700597 RepID=G2G5U1_9ACTN|nr:hypothetical protein SZN_04226 [Streptomyces zinciresistens K42]
MTGRRPCLRIGSRTGLTLLPFDPHRIGRPPV